MRCCLIRKTTTVPSDSLNPIYSIIGMQSKRVPLLYQPYLRTIYHKRVELALIEKYRLPIAIAQDF